MLEVDNIRFTYPPLRTRQRTPPHPAAATVQANFRVASGRSAALMGPSGCGKSTLLNLLAGLLQPQHGDLRFARQSLLPMTPAQRPLTYLLQSHNLFPHLNVRQNIAIGLHPSMRLSAQQHIALEQSLDWVSLQEFAGRKPISLSGGQQQRIALARCLARNRPLLLLDEPFTGLDETLRTELAALILALQKKHAWTVLLTTHQAQDAAALDAEIILM